MPYQLNTTTAYTFYSSSLLIEDYAKKAKELGYDGIAVSDDNPYAFPSHANACAKYGLKAIFGYKIQLKSSFGRIFHAYLYILSEKGYLNLCHLLSLKEKEYDIQTLYNHKEGLALVLGSENDFFDEGFLEVAHKDFYRYHKAFQGNFYFGITIDGNEQLETAHVLYDFIDDNEYNSICFPHVEYLQKKDAYTTNILKSAAQKKTIKDIVIEKEGPYFLLSPKNLESIYRKKEIDALEAFCSIINFDFFHKRGNLIHFDDENETLRSNSINGLKEKLDSDTIPTEYMVRLDYELEVIRKMNFSSYFLLVDDYVSFARKAGIKVGPGRGSAGGSLVAYSLGITKVDPIRMDLTFERFLNPERVTMPDIDIDFEDERRNEIPKYLKQKYGEERVCNIITFTKLKPRSALNLIGQVLCVNENRLKALSQSISDDAKDFDDAKNDSLRKEKFLTLYQDSYYKELCDLAESLLETPINTSIHAPGVILSDTPIYQTCPMSDGTKGIVSYEYPNMEKLGFLKVDILSLSNLSFLRHIEEKIIENGKQLPDIIHDLDNPEVYKTLNNLSIVEIFQLDTSYGMRDTIRKIHPDSFNDLASTISLYRPGPMQYIDEFAKRKQNPAQIIYQDERMKPILKDTYGIMVYQEQIMKVAQVLAGFSLGEADLLRRSISKKDQAKMNSYKEKFIQGCLKNQIEEEKAKAIYNDIEKFAEYGFNKSHAYSYSVITYSLLYYKTFFPEEFYLTSLKNESLGTSKTNDIITELKKINYKLKAPNINLSKAHDFTVIDKKIYLPLSLACRNDELLEIIEKERKEKSFTSFFDFINRVHSKTLNDDVRVFTDMISGGCFDCFSKSRLGMSNNLPTYMDLVHFGMEEDQAPKISDDGEDIGERMYLEKMILGRIVSCRLNQIFSKEGYQTFIVTDTSSLLMSGIIQVEDEYRKYKLKINRNSQIRKFSFILLKGFFRRKALFIEPDSIILLERKVVKHD
jgi:DNA polymerase III subunit alpha